MPLFKFGRKKRLPTTTYTNVTVALDYNLDVSDPAQRATMELLRGAMVAGTGYKMAADHCTAALENADIKTNESVALSQQLDEHRKVAHKASMKIQAEATDILQQVIALPESVQTEIAVELGIMDPPVQVAAAPVEKDINAQLLADARNAKKEEREARVAKKQEGKETSQMVNTFLETTETRVQQFEGEIGLANIREQTKTLENITTPRLKQQAKQVDTTSVGPEKWALQAATLPTQTSLPADVAPTDISSQGS